MVGSMWAWLGSGAWVILGTVVRLLLGSGNGWPRRTGRGGQDCDGALFAARPLSGHASSVRRQHAPPRTGDRQIKHKTPWSVISRVRPPTRGGSKILTVVSGGHRPVGFELVDGAFDDVALLVDLGVEQVG